VDAGQGIVNWALTKAAAAATSAPLQEANFVRIGIVSDIHCNAAGLRQALALMGDVEELICLGDSIWEYRFSNEVAQILKEREAHTILGNHEECFFGPLGERARARPDNDAALMDWLNNRPHRIELERDGKKLLLVHSTPWEPRGAYIHPDSPDLARFAEAEADFVLYGHTHRQVAKRFGHVMVINPGSAGDARDHHNGRMLSCAVLDTASEAVHIIDFVDPRLDQ
jgi:putative phosphoesterase